MFECHALGHTAQIALLVWCWTTSLKVVGLDHWHGQLLALWQKFPCTTVASFSFPDNQEPGY